MTLVFMAALISVVFGWALRGALVSRAATDSDPSRTVVLRELVQEHLRIARERMSAAEARIAILEERQAFHDGFLQVTPRRGPELYRTKPESNP